MKETVRPTWPMAVTNRSEPTPEPDNPISRVTLALLDELAQEDRGYDPYNANTADRAGQAAWRLKSKRA